jgi:hypothetical protein
MGGAILPLPNTPSWLGAQLKKKHRDNFTFTFKTEKVSGGWRRLHNEELHNLYALQNIFWVIKSR